GADAAIPVGQAPAGRPRRLLGRPRRRLPAGRLAVRDLHPAAGEGGRPGGTGGPPRPGRRRRQGAGQVNGAPRMKGLTPDDLLPLDDFAARRRELFESHVRYVDRYRRVRLGPCLTLLFENRQTLWF